MGYKEKSMIDYVILCVNEYAKAHGLAAQDSYAYLDKNKGIDFLLDFYPQESTLSLQVALEDMETVCDNNRIRST